MFACIHGRNIPDDVSLSDFAYSFSPLVEETTGDTVVIDVEGCELLFGSAYELANEIKVRADKAKEAAGLGCKVNVAIAANPDAAIYAARFFPGLTFISPGEETTCLGELPIEFLWAKSNLQSSQVPTPKESAWNIGLETLDEKRWEEILNTLKVWGIHSFAKFAALPIAGVSERLGQEGLRLQRLASGKSDRQLKLVQPVPVFTQSVALEHAIAELEPLAFIFARLLNQLCASLNSYALATNELLVEMKLDNGTSHKRKLSLPYPLRDHKVFLKLLLLDTEMHPPQAAVAAISISCEPTKPRVLQNGLFIPLAPEPEKLELTLARLTKLVGAENIGSPELVDTHRPDAFSLRRFALASASDVRQRRKKTELRQWAIVNRKCLLAFRVFRPPLRAIVEAAQGCPKQINAWGVNHSVYGKVVCAAGPWRTTGNWWRSDAWARDEWDVAVESRTGSAGQELYRLYRELGSGVWFVEGIYD